MKLTYRRAKVQRATDVRFVLDPASSEGLVRMPITLPNGKTVMKTLIVSPEDGIRQTPAPDFYMSPETAVGVTHVERSGPVTFTVHKAAPAPAAPPAAEGSTFSPEQIAKIQALVAAGLI